MIIDLQKVKNGELNLIAVNENINIIRDTIKKWDWYDENLYSCEIKTDDIDNYFDIIDNKGESSYNSDIHVIWEPISKKNTTIIRTEGDTSPFKRSLSFSGIECYAIRIYNDNNIYIAYSFQKMDQNGDSNRIIQYINEGYRSEFYQEGSLLPFENPEYYRRRRKIDRINPEIIIEYMSALGWNILDDNFWISSKDAYKDVCTFINE